MKASKRTAVPFLARCMGAAAIAVGGLLLWAQPASAENNCIQDVWKAHGNSQSLTCTANDVTLSSVSNICITAINGVPVPDPDPNGCQKPDVNGHFTCVSGQPFTFTADYTMPLTAQTRYDLGLYIATDGGGSDGALTGQCADNVLTSTNSPTFLQLDPAPDVCGDIDAAHNPQIFRQSLTATCTGTNGQVVLPFCTSWRQPGSNEVCDTSTFSTAATWDAYPGSPSKCNCGSLTIDVFSETASINVTKSVQPDTVPETGGSVTYTVTVENLAQVSTVSLDTLTDSIYGDITTTGHDGITATTCELVTIQAGSTPDSDPNTVDNPYTCTFTVDIPAGNFGDTIPDTATACGTDQFGHTNLCDSDNATVTYTNVTTNPSLQKTAHATEAVQVDVQFLVDVTNNSTVDTLTLKTLCDDTYGDLTGSSNAACGTGPFGTIVSTTCGKAGTDLPGALPADIAPLGHYDCSFVGRITSTGLHTDTVDGTATDDDGVDYPAGCTDPADPKCLEDSADVNISVTFP